MPLDGLDLANRARWMRLVSLQTSSISPASILFRRSSSFFSMMSHFNFGVGYLEADDRKYDVAGPGEVLVSILFICPLQSLGILLQESLPLFVGGDREEVLFEFWEVLVHFAAYPA